MSALEPATLERAGRDTAGARTDPCQRLRPCEPEDGLTAEERRDRNGLFERIAELLEVTYRSRDLGNFEDPLEESVYIILSRQTQEGVYRDTYSALRARYPTWIELLEAPVDEVRRLLFRSGFYRQRAKQLREFLDAVRKANQERAVGPFGNSGGDLTLDFLYDLDDTDAEAFLRALPGIGPKSARCVLHYSLGRDVFAVDTHVRRIFLRLGLVESKGIKADHDPFQEAVPPMLRRQLHVNLVHHGRAVCREKKPACHDCVLVSFCGEGRRRAAEMANRSAPIAIDLFSGAGGLSEGFKDAGFRVALAVEKDRSAAQTYRANHPGVPVAEEDVSQLTPRRVRELAVAAERVDVVLAGPPCQGYSMAGNRVADDEKNFLFREVGRLADGLDAEFVVMENVPGLERVGGREFVGSILASLRRRGYSAKRYLLDARDFGVPQRRRRYFFIARRKAKGVAPDPPTPAVREYEPGLLRKRLADLPELGPGVQAEYYELPDGGHLLNATTMDHSQKVIEKIEKIEQGGGPISYRRLEDDAARTLIAGHRALPVHPWLDRTVSVREAARIQGFRDDYVFCGPFSRQPLQVANAVAPAVATAIGAKLYTLWESGDAAARERVHERPRSRRPRKPFTQVSDVDGWHELADRPVTSRA